MMKETKHTSFPNPDWLRRMAEAEDRCESISVGGLAADTGAFRTPATEPPRVFGRFLEFARRERAMSVEALAESANVDLAELVAIETEKLQSPTPRTVYQLAMVLKIPPETMSEIAGLTQPRSAVSEAAVRFAARSEPTAKLTEGERHAFEEFVKVLVEASD